VLSDSAFKLAYMLRELVGSDVKGIGPETSELVDLWGELPPVDLKPAMLELERWGFLGVDRGMGPRPSHSREYGLRNVIGIRVMEPLQAYFDDLD